LTYLHLYQKARIAGFFLSVEQAPSLKDRRLTQLWAVAVHLPEKKYD
jgi:hypothetical protein